MFEDDFAKKLLQLRQQKNVTARDMSLFISQNYLNALKMTLTAKRPSQQRRPFIETLIV